jgi:hypothetical protein
MGGRARRSFGGTCSIWGRRTVRRAGAFVPPVDLGLCDGSAGRAADSVDLRSRLGLGDGPPDAVDPRADPRDAIGHPHGPDGHTNLGNPCRLDAVRQRGHSIAFGVPAIYRDGDEREPDDDFRIRRPGFGRRRVTVLRLQPERRIHKARRSRVTRSAAG